VIRPYLVGEDLNSHPEQKYNRHVICFYDWPLNRDTAPAGYQGPVAEDYPDCLSIVRRLVQPERESKRENNTTALDRAKKWWLFGRYAGELYETISGMPRVLAISLITNHVCFAFVPSTWIYAHKLAIFPLSEDSHLALLQSSVHYWWAWEYSSTNLSLLNYSHSDCFETFPFPVDVDSLSDIGHQYELLRRDSMLSRRIGLTPLYNRFHTSHEISEDIVKLRAKHVAMDHAVASAYGWTDLDLGHGFHETKQGVRYTVSVTARREVLDRLLALNHERYAQEQDAVSAEPKPKRKKARRTVAQPELF
jgi:hypothetical protein